MARVIGRLEQDLELVAAEARDQIVGLQAVAQTVGHQAQQFVARGVAAGVVHFLELVQVDAEQG